MTDVGVGDLIQRTVKITFPKTEAGNQTDPSETEKELRRILAYCDGVENVGVKTKVALVSFASKAAAAGACCVLCDNLSVGYRIKLMGSTNTDDEASSIATASTTPALGVVDSEFALPDDSNVATTVAKPNSVWIAASSKAGDLTNNRVEVTAAKTSVPNNASDSELMKSDMISESIKPENISEVVLESSNQTPSMEEIKPITNSNTEDAHSASFTSDEFPSSERSSPSNSQTTELDDKLSVARCHPDVDTKEADRPTSDGALESVPCTETLTCIEETTGSSKAPRPSISESPRASDMRCASKGYSNDADMNMMDSVYKLKQRIKMMEAEARVRERERLAAEKETKKSEESWSTELTALQMQKVKLEDDVTCLKEEVRELQIISASKDGKIDALGNIMISSASTSSKSISGTTDLYRHTSSDDVVNFGSEKSSSKSSGISSKSSKWSRKSSESESSVSIDYKRIMQRAHGHTGPVDLAGAGDMIDFDTVTLHSRPPLANRNANPARPKDLKPNKQLLVDYQRQSQEDAEHAKKILLNIVNSENPTVGLEAVDVTVPQKSVDIVGQSDVGPDSNEPIGSASRVPESAVPNVHTDARISDQRYLNGQFRSKQPHTERGGKPVSEVHMYGGRGVRSAALDAYCRHYPAVSPGTIGAEPTLRDPRARYPRVQSFGPSAHVATNVALSRKQLNRATLGNNVKFVKEKSDPPTERVGYIPVRPSALSSSATVYQSIRQRIGPHGASQPDNRIQSSPHVKQVKENCPPGMRHYPHYGAGRVDPYRAALSARSFADPKAKSVRSEKLRKWLMES